ncbi:MAG: Rrf2 family transcriptional regulator [Planctomycetes bacterium]|jgi:Rrf2 family protein|nr:Rrf2 family transcriptional regulator [Planctomycetota bacterium]
MLRISKKADYAVFLLGAIARQGAYPGGSAGLAVVSAHEIARQAGLNKSVVANLLKEFAKSGLLESTRGLRGGYRLGRPPSEISLGDILEVVEGRFVLVDCVAHGGPAAEVPDAKPTSLLALAPSMRAASGSATASSKRAAEPRIQDASHDCALISFCPSKQPMRIVHERISQLFRDIHLDELCAMAPPPRQATGIKATR